MAGKKITYQLSVCFGKFIVFFHIRLTVQEQWKEDDSPYRCKQTQCFHSWRKKLGKVVEKETREYGRNLDYHDIRQIARDIKNGEY